MRTQETDREVFRLAPPLVLWWAWVAFAVANVADFAIEGAAARFAVVVSAVLVTVTGLVYALALRPRVVAGPPGLTIVNPFRDHHVPWAAIQAVDTGEWVRVHYAAAQDYAPGQRSSADSKAIWCWGLYVSSRARRQAARAGSPAGFARPAPRARRFMALSGMLADAGRATDTERARLPAEARYLASLPAARAIAVRLDTRADRERARLAQAATGQATAQAATGQAATGQATAQGVTQAPVTARWAWPPVAAVALPLLALLIIVLA